jgi:uncharacterized YigZ family protein
VVEKSRFLCTLQKVESEKEAQEFIKGLKKKYWDATHNCSAYIVGTAPRAERSNDDGEPSGTAGSPMLEVLRQKKVSNVVAVVTRYFGGIKLGAGGLTRTYGRCVSEAVKAAGLSEVVPMARFTFDWPVEDVGRVLNLLYQQDLFVIAEVRYGEKAGIFLELPLADRQKAETWLTETLNRVISLEKTAVFSAERPVVKPLS